MKSKSKAQPGDIFVCLCLYRKFMNQHIVRFFFQRLFFLLSPNYTAVEARATFAGDQVGNNKPSAHTRKKRTTSKLQNNNSITLK